MGDKLYSINCITYNLFGTLHWVDETYVYTRNGRFIICSLFHTVAHILPARTKLRVLSSLIQSMPP